MSTRSLTYLGVCLAILVGGVVVFGGADKPGDNAALKAQLKDLLKQRLETAVKAAEAMQAAFEAETVTLDDLVYAINKLAEADVAFAATPEQEIAALKRQVERATLTEKKIKALFDVGTRGGEAKDYYTAKRERESAEIALVEARLRTGH